MHIVASLEIQLETYWTSIYHICICMYVHIHRAADAAIDYTVSTITLMRIPRMGKEKLKDNLPLWFIKWTWQTIMQIYKNPKNAKFEDMK